MSDQRGLALLAELETAGAFTATGLRLADPNLSYDSYAAIAAYLGEMRKAFQWAIGDFIVLGEKLFGERCYQALELLEISEKGMMEYARVSQRVPRSTRRKDLSWSHHRAVAVLPPPEQKQWLKAASEQGLSHHQLREALSNEARDEREVCPSCGRPL